MQREVLAAVAAAVTASPLFLPGSVEASHDIEPNPDNAQQDVERIELGWAGQNAFYNGEIEVGASEINFATGTSDLHVRDIAYSTDQGWAGLIWCSGDWWPGGRCDHFQVRFNTRFEETGHYTAENWKATGCHEYGHTGGLGHRADEWAAQSCMKDPPSSLSLTNHDLVTINGDV